uniref:Calcium signal-modulating cyclophilin ligand n=1 Tax=Strigamia maritima TaxID=126957 RepID=T1IWX8_STRMM
MADMIAKRREARRRKILENSENRLKKLLGETVNLNNEGDSSNISTTTPPSSSPLSVSSAGPFTPDSWTKTSPLILDNKQNDNNEPKVDDENVPALSARHLLRGITDEIDFRYEDLSSARIEDVAALASRIQQKESSIERLQQRSNVKDEIIPARQSAKSIPIMNNYWFAKPKMRKLFYVVLAVLVYLTHMVDFILYFVGKVSIFLPFIVVEVGIVSYELVFVPHTSVSTLNTAHSLMNGALMLSGVPESLIIKISKVISYVARFWEEFSIFLFTFLFLHWFVTEVCLHGSN